VSVSSLKSSVTIVSGHWVFFLLITEIEDISKIVSQAQNDVK